MKNITVSKPGQWIGDLFPKAMYDKKGLTPMTITKKSPIVLTPDETGKHRISFTATSSLYKVTDAGGYAEDALQSGFVSLGDGCDYRLLPEDILKIKRRIKLLNNKKTLEL